MFKYFNRLILLVVVLTLNACATLVPKEHLIPKAQLARTLEQQFPLRHEEGGGLLRIEINSPRLSMEPEQNRVRVHGVFTASTPLMGLQGDFIFSSKFLYRPEQQAIFLSEARFEPTQPSGNFLEDNLRALLNQELSGFVSQNPIYSFRPDELLVMGVKMDVSEIKVVSEGILIKLHALN